MEDAVEKGKKEKNATIVMLSSKNDVEFLHSPLLLFHIHFYLEDTTIIHF